MADAVDKSAFMVIQPKLIVGDKIIGHVNIGPAIAIEVGRYHA